MLNVSYVYPNTKDLNKKKLRGGLLKRWRRLLDLNLVLNEELEKHSINVKYIEVPAHLTSKATFITAENISEVYEKENNVPRDVNYILHTEYRDDRIKWRDDSWVRRYIDMIIVITRFFGRPASIIEIHSGLQKYSSPDGLLKSINNLLEKYYKNYKFEPLILIVNRPKQIISNGKTIRDFWDLCIKNDLEKRAGIVLDVKQLYTKTKDNFFGELEKIPFEAIKGFHIHNGSLTGHLKVPNIQNKIPWDSVFKKVANMSGNVIINPEVHHSNKVGNTIKFCEEMLTLSAQYAPYKIG